MLHYDTTILQMQDEWHDEDDTRVRAHLDFSLIIDTLEHKLRELKGDFQERDNPRRAIPYYRLIRPPRSGLLEDEHLLEYITEVNYYIRSIIRIKEEAHRIDDILKKFSDHKDYLYSIYRPGYKLRSNILVSQKKRRRRRRCTRDKTT